MNTKQGAVITDQQLDKINEIIDAHKETKGGLIPILHEVQEEYGYLPIEVQKIISEKLNAPLAEIYGIVTFYTQFLLTPRGKYSINVCLGTACYVKGAGKILERFQKNLGIDVGGVTDDLKFSLNACRCIGSCGLAPVAVVNNEDVYDRLKPEDVDRICKKYAEA